MEQPQKHPRFVHSFMIGSKQSIETIICGQTRENTMNETK